jgi:Flp pilus assembly protein TadD
LVELLPISETEFVRRDQNVSYTFVRNAEGCFGKVRIKFDGGMNEGTRMSGDARIPYELLIAGKADEALEAYRCIQKEQPDNNAVNEDRLNRLGYTLMRDKKLSAAIEIFKLNVEFYPRSFNVYDSLGAAYMENGDKELATKNYRKSIELNPKNAGGIEMLKKLKGK